MEMKNEQLCDEPEETVESLLTNSNLLNDAAPDGSLIPENGTASSWEDQLDVYMQKVEKLQETCEQSFLEIGRVLIQARDVYKGHGNWIQWLNDKAPFSVRHAQRLIRVAEMFDDASLTSQLGLTLSKACILTRVGKSDLDYFLHTIFTVGGKRKFVKDMTKRELNLVVKTFLSGKLAPRNREEVTSTQGRETSGESVESNLEKLKVALSRTIASIKGSDLDTRESWISALEALCKESVDQLTSETE